LLPYDLYCRTEERQVEREQQEDARERAQILIRALIPDWRPTPTQALWVARAAIVLGIPILIGYSYGITLWDWLELLIVPVVIAVGGFWFNRQQQERQLQSDKEHAQDDALQAYLDQISQLLTDKERPLDRSRPGDRLSAVARARTLTVLPILDGQRKRRVLQFLYEGRLIIRTAPGPVVDLDHADLKGAELRGIDLQSAQMRAVRLQGANLMHSNLRGVYLHNSNLSGANLEGAELSPAETDGIRRPAILTKADFMDTVLDDADLRGVDLREVKFLVQEQIERARGDRDTLLPPELSRPSTWGA